MDNECYQQVMTVALRLQHGMDNDSNQSGHHKEDALVHSKCRRLIWVTEADDSAVNVSDNFWYKFRPVVLRKQL